jgi:colanic acid/amylovoran biosynthesis glycosyltransferase
MSSDGETRPLKVVHLVNRWLPFSQSWIHAQATGVPGVDSVVVARVVMEGAAGRFPHPNIISLKERFPIMYRVAMGVRPFTLRAVAGLAAGPLEELRPDVAHAHFGHFAWRYLQAVKQAGVPLVATFYGYDMSRLARKAEWRKRYGELFDAVSVVLCEGPHMAGRIKELGCPAEKVRVHELGADFGRCEFVKRERRTGETLRVLAAARFTEKKGLPDAVRAVGRAAKQVPIELTIVGEASGSAEQNELQSIRTAVAETGLGERVRMTGRLPFDELIRLAGEHHVFLQPSIHARDGDSEGGAPVIIMELMATGMPVVGTRHCDIPHLVDDGVTGLLSDEGDIEGLAAALTKLAEEPERAAQMGRKGFERATGLFNLEVRRRALTGVYAEVARSSACATLGRPEPSSGAKAGPEQQRA